MKKLLLSALSILMLVGCAFKEQGTTIPHGQTQETEKKPIPDVRLLKQDKYDIIKLYATSSLNFEKHLKAFKEGKRN